MASATAAKYSLRPVGLLQRRRALTGESSTWLHPPARSPSRQRRTRVHPRRAYL